MMLLRADRLFEVGLLAFAVGLTFAPPTACADSMALWRIVHDACVPHVEAGDGPKPCETVDLTSGVGEGVAILKDLVGVAQMLAIPTRRITGIEDPQMLVPDAPPVFADGWKAKALVEARLGQARCRARRLRSRSTRNGRAARNSCTSTWTAWRSPSRPRSPTIVRRLTITGAR